MIKIMGAILVAISGMGISFYMCMNERERIDELNKMLRLFNKMASVIRFDEATLPDIAAGFSIENDCYGSFFRTMQERMNERQREPFDVIWTGCVKECLKDTCLTKEDKREMISVGVNLVNTDKQLQLAIISDYAKDVKRKIDSLREQLKTQTKLYMSFGALGSMFVIILLY